MQFTKERMIQMAQQMPGNIVIYLVKDKLERIYYSEGIPALSGYTLEEYEKMKDSDAFLQLLETDRQTIEKKTWECIKKQKDVDFTYRLRHKNGEYSWVNAKACVIGTWEGAPALLAILSDVSKETEKYELLLDSSERMIFVCDKMTREILYANQNFCSDIKKEKTEVVGKKCYDILCKKEPSMQNCCSCYYAIESGTALLDYRAETDQYFNLEGKQIDWCGHDSYVFFYSDVTKQKKKEIEDRTVYRHHMDSVMKMNPNAICSFRFNLTKNICENGVSSYPNILLLQEQGTIDGYISSALRFIPEKQERILFQETFQREHLLQAFQKGDAMISFEHSYLVRGKERRFLNSTIDMVRNPVTKDVEGITYAIDITSDYYQQTIQKLLYEQEYECVGIIDVLYEQYTLRSISFGNAEQSIKRSHDYEDECVQAANLYIFPEDRRMFLENTSLNHIISQLAKNKSYFFTLNGKGKNGKKVLYKYSYYYLDKQNMTILSTIEDVTKVMNQDILTGEYNRQGFINHVTHVLRDSKKEEAFAILFLNIKGFKAINELFGVEGGDYVLRESVELLRKSSIKPIAIARFEADHFVALVHKEEIDFQELTRLCHRSVNMNGKQFKFYGRCGIYYIEDKKRSVSGMCDRAKLAKDYIADDYVKPYAIFDRTMREVFIRKKELTSEMEHSLKNKEFSVYYQPIYDVKTGRIASAEALVRWIHPILGVVSPGMFVPAFEENGYISELDLFVEKTVKQFLEKRVCNQQCVVPIAVNLSRMDFYDEQMLEQIMEDIRTSSFPKGSCRFEITESSYSTILDCGNNILSTLKQLGVKILIDDFGSGYSSFSSIRDFDFDIIKIDIGFVQQIGISDKAEWILNSIIDMAHHIHVKVIAEGVETKEQADFLASLHCDYIQGFYYARPMPEKEFIALLNKSEPIGPDKKSVTLGPSSHMMLMNRLINALPGGVAIYRCGEQIETIYYSDGIPKLSGHTPQEYDLWVKKDIVTNVVFNDDQKKVRRTIAEAIQYGKSFNITYRIYHKNGSLIWVQLSASQIRIEDKCPIYYAIYTKPTEENLQFQKIVENAPFCVLVMEEQSHKILYANNAMKNNVHKSLQKNILGLRFEEVIREEHPMLSVKELENLSGETFYECCRQREDGRCFIIHSKKTIWCGCRSYIFYIKEKTQEIAISLEGK